VRYNHLAVSEESLRLRPVGDGREAVSDPQADLIDACSRGDRDAFGRLFEACKDRVYAVALRLTNDPTEAADVTQDVFLKLLTRMPQFRRDARFSTWLHRIVINTFLDRRRSARRFVPLAEPDVPDGVELEREAGRAETARLVEERLAGLEAKLRIPLVLRFVAGLSYEEIGAVLQLPMGTVASRLSRALRGLAATLPHPRDLEV
jgi:RNA polymerase sigma-70 factor, ECF subfamily